MSDTCWALVPAEVLQTVFGWLGYKDLISCSQVCKSWRTVAHDNSLWLHFIRRIWQLTPAEVRYYGINISSASPSLYQRIHKHRQQVERNWLEPSFQPYVLKGHTDLVLCLQLCSSTGTLISGSFDTTIKQWDLQTLQCIRTLYGHGDGVLCVHSFENLIVSGSYDMTIILWNQQTGEPIATLADHTGWVVCVQYNGERLISGSWDTTLRMWSLRPDGQHTPCLRVFEGHKEAVTSLHFRDDTLVSGSGDKTIRIWQISSGDCLQILTGHTDLVRSIRLEGDRIFSASFDQKVKVWSLMTGQCHFTLTGHHKGIWTICVDHDRLITGSRDGSVIVWRRTSNDQYTLTLQLYGATEQHEQNPQLISFPMAAASARPRTRGGTGWSATPLAAVLRDADEEEGGEGPARNEPIALTPPPPRTTTQALPTTHDFYSVQADFGCVYAGCGDNTIRIWDFAPPFE